MTTLRARCHRGEAGAFIVLWALLILAVLIMVAIVIDLSALRQARRQQRLAADSAVTAGGLALKRTAVGRLAACEDAWSYAAQNLGFDPAPASPCGGYDVASGGTDCVKSSPSSAVPQFATGTLGAYTVTITTPVLNNDALMKADAIGGDLTQPANSSTGTFNSDGEPCSRIGVRIMSTQSASFAQVIGQGSGTTNSHSVARATIDEGDLRPSLVVLEPHKCNAMEVTGTPSIEVVGTTATPGGIVIVSDGNSCPTSGAGAGYVLNVGSGKDNSHVTAAFNGNIFLKAGSGSCVGSACDPSQLDDPTCWKIDPALTNCTGYSPIPQPIDVPINRSRIDYLYNCRTGYTTGTGNYTNVSIDGGNMADCTGTSGDYLNKIFQTVTSTGSGLRLPSGTTWDLIVGDDPKKKCADPLPPLPSPGNVQFNCDASGLAVTVDGHAWFRQTGKPEFKPLAVRVNGSADFDGDVNPSALFEIRGNAYFGGTMSIGGSADVRIRGNSFFAGDISVSGGNLSLRGTTGSYPTDCVEATFITNVSSCARLSGYTAATATAPSAGGALSFLMGNLKQTGGAISVDRVMVYGGPNAALSRTGGGDLTWFPPSEGPFRKLAFWSDLQAASHELSGNGVLNVDGVYFAPGANFTLGGNPSAIPQDAQFWALTLKAAGTATFRMTPDPELPSLPLAPSVRLIR